MKLAVFAGICIATLSSSGCLFFDNRVVTDVTQDPVYWRYYRRDGIYTLLRPVFLHKYYNSGDLSLTPPDPGDRPPTYRYPTLDEYLAAPARFQKITGIIAADTRLQVTSAVRHSDTTTYYAKILDGPFAGTVVVVNDLEPPDFQWGFAARPSPKYLRLNP
jgi:hypothetical protein